MSKLNKVKEWEMPIEKGCFKLSIDWTDDSWASNKKIPNWGVKEFDPREFAYMCLGYYMYQLHLR